MTTSPKKAEDKLSCLVPKQVSSPAKEATHSQSRLPKSDSPDHQPQSDSGTSTNAYLAKVHGWGRTNAVWSQVIRFDDSAELLQTPPQSPELIARGLGRSYGDAAQLNQGTVLETGRLKAWQWVDQKSGLIRVEAGITIGELIDWFTPIGWFVPVSPGTRHVTVGGAIACDIHGKNHHRDGTFGAHVKELTLMLANNQVIKVGPQPDCQPDIFWATVGGMGLTGVIIDATFSLTAIPSSFVEAETERLSDLATLMQKMREGESRFQFSVAWLDLLGKGRGVLSQGNFASPELVRERAGAAGVHQRPGSWAFKLPPVPIPKMTVTPAIKVFNEAWFRKAPAELSTTIEGITGYWHPLDAISDWNRLYGRSGFYQWQCAIPDSAGDDAFIKLCEMFYGQPAFLTVLKRFGAANRAPLSFPMTGWTLAVDLPATNSVKALMNRADPVVQELGGRLYLAKDARQSREFFTASYPRLEEWKKLRASLDPHRRFQSDLANRLGL